MKLPFAAESRNEIGVSTFLFIAALLITIMFPTAVAFVFLLLVGAIWVVILRFFRDPHRQIPPDQDVYLSPADGRVVTIDIVDEPDFMNHYALPLPFSLISVVVGQPLRASRQVDQDSLLKELSQQLDATLEAAGSH